MSAPGCSCFVGYREHENTSNVAILETHALIFRIMAMRCIRQSLRGTRTGVYSPKLPESKCTRRNVCSQSNQNTFKSTPIFSYSTRNFYVNSVLCGSAARAETTSTIQGLSKLQAQELVLRLTPEERNILISSLQEYQSKLVKDEYEGIYYVELLINSFKYLHKRSKTLHLQTRKL